MIPAPPAGVWSSLKARKLKFGLHSSIIVEYTPLLFTTKVPQTLSPAKSDAGRIDVNSDLFQLCMTWHLAEREALTWVSCQSQLATKCCLWVSLSQWFSRSLPASCLQASDPGWTPQTWLRWASLHQIYQMSFLGD